MNKLALYGGEPVRKKPFPSKLLGATFIGEEELSELKDVIDEKSPFRHYGIGNPKKVTTFEEEVRNFFGCRFALAVSSGTGALMCAVAALGIGPGDEVILPSFGWYSDYSAIISSGALPVFADVDETLSLDPADFEKKITSKTKAAIVIYYQGCAAQMDEIVTIAKKHGLKIIEDCAQAFGGMYKDKKLGTIGDVAISSFQSNKILTCGEGGILITDNEKYFARAVRYHDLGFMRPVFEEQLKDTSLAGDDKGFAGFQFRMSELQGAFILAQFRKLDRILERCREYHKKIRDHFNQNRHFKIRYVDGDCGITLFMLFGTKEEAEKFNNCLVAEGIPSGPTSHCENIVSQYPIKSKNLVHDSLPPFGKGFNGECIKYDIEKCCPNTDKISERFVAIGVGPMYSDEDVEDIIRAIAKVDMYLYSQN